ncbi:MAG: Gfo/Idh/MocA family oxidoreductase [Candidatus Bipolaricaulaceae bacterium]
MNTWDSSWATFQFRDGAVAVVETGWGLPENAWGDVKVYVTGTRGQCALDMVAMNLMVAGPQGWRFPITRLWAEVQGRMVGALQAEVAHFIACLEFDRPPSVDGLDGRRSLEVAVAIERSIEQDCEIQLPLS